jgi:DNA repair protein RecN (Recombination protein N)
VLRELHIGGLGVIDDLDLELHPGLNVLTGETGTGKTMVTVGLALALGARSTGALVREGSTSARVEARFDAPPGADEWAEDGEVILARSIGPDGKGRARISGRLATASSLGELGAELVEIHGQQQAHRLRSSATQTAFLDRSAGPRHLETLRRYREAWDRWRSLDDELRALREAERERQREIDLLAFQVREIEAVDPGADETDELLFEEALLGNAERLAETGSRVEEALAGEPSAVDGLREAAAALRGVASIHPTVGRIADRAEALTAELEELARDVRRWTDSLVIDPERLAAVRARIQALGSLRRKYGETDGDVLAFLRDAAARLAALTGQEDLRGELEVTVAEARASVEELSERLSRGRREAAPRLADAIGSELHDLGMPSAGVRLELMPRDAPGPTGSEEADLGISPGPRQPILPITKTASGGELSRVMLACRSVLADADDVPTLVFDEIDAGIGGEAGLAVGRRLGRLARARQVIVGTHLPQIACFADRHVRVEKVGGRATVHILDDDERVRELSRMLAGLADSHGAATHAQELLATARASV